MRKRIPQDCAPPALATRGPMPSPPGQDLRRLCGSRRKKSFFSSNKMSPPVSYRVNTTPPATFRTVCAMRRENDNVENSYENQISSLWSGNVCRVPDYANSCVVAAAPRLPCCFGQTDMRFSGIRLPNRRWLALPATILVFLSLVASTAAQTDVNARVTQSTFSHHWNRRSSQRPAGGGCASGLGSLHFRIGPS